MSCVIFGAGKIARGFVGHLLYLSGIEFTFVEKVDALVDLINERREYLVNILGNSEKNTIVKGAKALSFARKDEISKAIAQALLLPVPRTTVTECTPEEIAAIPSKRGEGALGSSNK